MYRAWVHTASLQRARLAVQVERLRYTRLRHRTCKTSGSSKKASHPASAQNVQDLVVQVERLRYTWLRHRTCKTSRSSKKASVGRFAAYRGTSLCSWFQKSADYPSGIWTKIPTFLKLEVGIFSDQKCFSKNGKIREIIFFQTNYERSFKRFAEHFLTKNTPDFSTWSWIFFR